MISSTLALKALSAPGLSARARLGTPRQLVSAPNRATVRVDGFARGPAASFLPALHDPTLAVRRRVSISSSISGDRRGASVVPSAVAKATFDSSTPSGYTKQFTLVRLTVFLRCEKNDRSILRGWACTRSRTMRDVDVVAITATVVPRTSSVPQVSKHSSSISSSSKRTTARSHDADTHPPPSSDQRDER